MFNDLSGNSNNGVVNGASLVSDRFGNINSAYNFNGNSNISITDASDLNFQANNIMSISFWEKTSTNQAYRSVLIQKISGVGNTTAGYDIGLDNAGNTSGPLYMALAVKNGSSNNWGGVSDATVNYIDNNWHHIVFVYNSGLAQIYTDGILTNTTTSNAGIIGNNTNQLLFGATLNPQASSNNFIGTIDDIGIWSRALTQQEVTNLYTSSISCVSDITTGLVAQYDFTGNANDLSGNGNNGTVYGATLTSDRFGNPNSAYNFVNGADKIVVPDNNSLSLTGSFGFNFWINNSGYNGSFNGILSKYEAGSCNHNGYFIGMMSWSGEDKIELQADPICSNANSYEPNANGKLNTGQWYNIGLTYDQPNTKLIYYVNGVKIDSFIVALSVQNTTYDLIIGNHVAYPYTSSSTGANFQGAIDDIRIYNRLLTQCDMDSLYKPNTSTTNANCIPPIANLCSNGYYIDSVIINNLSNGPSGCNGNANNYIQYPSSVFTTTLNAGTTYSMTITSGVNALNYGVWIDFNHDSLFSANEFVDSSLSASTSFVSNVTIPNMVQIGATGMRVRSKIAAFAGTDGCTSALNGETEDYTITIIQNTTSVKTIIDEKQITIYPNPATNKLNIRSYKSLEQIEIYNFSGQLVKSIQNAVTSVNISDLENGFYLLRLTSSDSVQSFKFLKQ